MDAAARKRRGRGEGRWMSINWDGWERRHGSVEPSTREEGSSRLVMTAEEGVACFERILSLGVGPQVVVSTGELEARIEKWIKQEWQREKEFGGLVEGPPAQARPELGNAYVAPRDEIEEGVAGVWQELLGIESIGAQDNFFELGGHSLIATQLISRLNKRFRIVLPIKSIFEAPTIAGLSEHVRAISWAAEGMQSHPSEAEQEREVGEL